MLMEFIYSILIKIDTNRKVHYEQKIQEEQIHQQVESLMLEHNWSYSKAFAYYMASIGNWEF